MENIDFKALFNKPEPDSIEQQKAHPPCVYHCGIQQLEPYRQQERKPYTHEELQELYNAKIEARTLQWGADHYYTRIRETLTDAGVELPEVKKIKQQRIECCYDALDDIERRIKEYTQEHKAKDHKQEVLELEYTAVVELMQQLSDKRKAGGRK